ncbi:MAG: DUF3488 domain-containing protein, partial [Proteobacteria bacterium]|nr:DUF3488 domain-containing protein [Pseudomonadota bacterium]
FLSWQLMLIATFTMVAMSHAATTPPLVLSCILCMASAFLYRHFNSKVLGRMRIAGYGLSVAIALWAFYGDRQNKDIASIAMELLLAMLPALLQNMVNQRRIFAALAVTNLLAIAGILLADNLSAYGTFLVFIATMAMTLNATRMYFLSTRAGDAGERLTVTFFYQLLRTVPLGLVFGSLIFYWFPRMSDLAVDLNLSGIKSKTGFNNEVSLTGKGSIEESNRINLWVYSKNVDWLAGQADMIYLRGTSLSSFDGTTWRNSGTLSKLASQTPDFRVNKAQNRGQMDLTFFREPTSVREVFHPYGLWNLDVPARIAQEIFVDNFGNIVFVRDDASRYQYDVRFGPMNPSAFDGMSAPLEKYLAMIAQLPKETRRFYELSRSDAALLQSVPEGIDSQPWFNEFRAQVSNLMKGPVESIPVATILHNTQKYFRQQYKASLRVEFKGDSNLKDFMGGKKEGHCELFATAAALYLRKLGIPVRLVSGYMGGQFNFVSHMLEVPERNAHVWLEIFQPGSGWLPFDPTPMILKTGSNSVLQDGAMVVFNALRFWFTRYVIDYDAKAQKELVVALNRVDMSKLLDFKQVSLDRDTGELGVLAVMLVIAAWLLFRVVTRDDRLPDAPAYYRSLAARLMAAGLEKKKSESYLDFHKRLLDEGINPELIYNAHFALERDLYAPASLSKAEQRTLRRKLRKMPIWPKIKRDPQTGPSRLQAHG